MEQFRNALSLGFAAFDIVIPVYYNAWGYSYLSTTHVRLYLSRLSENFYQGRIRDTISCSYGDIKAVMNGSVIKIIRYERPLCAINHIEVYEISVDLETLEISHNLAKEYPDNFKPYPNSRVGNLPSKTKVTIFGVADLHQAMEVLVRSG